MSRRVPLLLALIASFVVTACAAAPAAPPLTDPKEILVKSVTSLQDVKTFTMKGSFSGSVVAEGMGNFDLSSMTLEVAADVPGKKARVQFDAPSLLGTNIDLIAVDDAAYVKILGMLGGMIGADASGKYIKMDAGSEVPEDATDPLKAIEELRKGIDELPNPPVKLADEKCGDQDCYHIQITASGEDLGEVADEAAALGSLSFDIFTRKSDLRPGKIGFSMDAGDQGTVNGTFDITYDGSVDIQAPPADQVTEGTLGG